MPRGIGASVGVKETVTGRAGGRGEVLLDLGGVPVRAADAVRRHRAHHLGAEQVRLERPAGAGGAARRRRRRRRRGSSSPAAKPGARARRDGGRVAARARRSGRARRARSRCCRRRPAAARAGRRASVPAWRCRRSWSRPPASASRKSAPQSIDDDVVGQLRPRGRPRRRAAGRGRRRRGRRASRAWCSSRTGRRAGAGAGGSARAAAGVRGRGERADLELGVAEQQPEDLAAGVPARPCHCCCHHVHEYTGLLQFLCSQGQPSGSSGPHGWQPQGAVVRADPAGGLRPQRGGGVGAGADIATGPRVELARASASSRSVTPRRASTRCGRRARRMLSVMSVRTTPGRQVERPDAVLPAGLVQTAGQPGEGRLARAVRREVTPLADPPRRWPG